MLAEQFRILVDECVRHAVAEALRDWGYDALRVPRAGGRNSPSDPAVIAYAAESGRIVLTDDVSTMSGYFQAFLDDGNHHPGMIVAPQNRGLGQYLYDLRYTLENTRPEDLRDNWIWLKSATAPAGGA